MTKSTPASAAHDDLLLEHPAHGLLRLLVSVDIDVRVADVSGEKRAGLFGDLLRDGERLAVDLLEQVLLADDPHLLAVRVVRERLDDVRARANELAVELRDDVRLLEHDFWDERACLEISAPLELEEIALGADHRAFVEPLEKPLAHGVIMSDPTEPAPREARGRRARSRRRR